MGLCVQFLDILILLEVQTDLLELSMQEKYSMPYFICASYFFKENEV